MKTASFHAWQIFSEKFDVEDDGKEELTREIYTQIKKNS